MSKSGFTLVELAIVIVIIGLLVGGVLQGQELIKQAQIRSNIKRFTEIKTAAATFYGKYNCLPGDCVKATSYGLWGSGNGDGRITVGDSAFFWLHLIQAKMLNVTRIDGTAFSTTNYDRQAKILEGKGGNGAFGYASFNDIYQGNDPGFPYPDLVTAINNNNNLITVTTQAVGGVQNYGAFTSDETRGMDEKIDDGNALTGKFFGANTRNVATFALNTCSNSGVYVNNDKDLLCRVLFEIGL